MRKIKMVGALILACMLVVVSVSGCAAQSATEVTQSESATEATAETSATDTTDSAQKTYKIGFAICHMNSGFIIANVDAVRARAAEIGNVELLEMVANSDADVQNQQISDMISNGCDAIIINAYDSEAIVTAINKCQSAGIPVIMDNRPASEEASPDATVVADNKEMAYQIMKWFIEKAQADGKTYTCALMMGDLGDQNAVERTEGYHQALDEIPGVVNVVAEIPTEWDLEVALAGLQNALQANPDINMIVVPSDGFWSAIQSALEQVDKWAPIGSDNHVAVISFDGDIDGMQAMKDGYSWGDAAQDAVWEGETCVDLAVQLASGETLESNIVLDTGIICTLSNFDETKESVWGWSGVE